MTGSALNLCLACRNVEPDAAGGLARATRDLAQALAGQGHHVHLLTNPAAAERLDLPGVSVRAVQAQPAAGRFADSEPDTAADNILHAAAVYREVCRIHAGPRPVDAVLAPLWRSEGAVCVLDDRFPTAISCMTSIQTLTEVDPAWRQFPDLAERITLEREALRRSRFLHGLTEAALAKTIRDHQLTPEATAVIGRGLCDRGVPGRPATAPDTPVNVLYVGRIEHRKGIDTLLNAARELVSAGVPARFILAGPRGDPSYLEKFQLQAATDPRLRAAVDFTGEVSDTELNRLYAEADVVCLPSRYESHGIVLLEAMMAAKPILTCAAGGIAEVITPGRDALAVAPDDPEALAAGLRLLVADPDLRARLGAAARETFTARFDVQTVAQRMASFMQAIGNGNGRATPQMVSERLAGLIAAVLGLEPAAAWETSQALLDPGAGGRRQWPIRVAPMVRVAGWLRAGIRRGRSCPPRRGDEIGGRRARR